MSEIIPTHIALHQQSRELEIHFSDDGQYHLPCEYLRVFSPSAEVKAAKNRGEIIRGKKEVNINAIEPMGSYAIRIIFDDGHDSGVYSWSTLKLLSEQFEDNWKQYQQQLSQLEEASSERRVKVLFFIGLVELLGTESLMLELDDDIQNISQLIDQLTAKGENWTQALDKQKLTITVNKQFSSLDQVLFDGDEVALVPKAC
jgi:DUF971 family protein/molybdopterin converting factor small subunit